MRRITRPKDYLQKVMDTATYLGMHFDAANREKTKGYYSSFQK